MKFNPYKKGEGEKSMSHAKGGGGGSFGVVFIG